MSATPVYQNWWRMWRGKRGSARGRCPVHRERKDGGSCKPRSSSSHMRYRRGMPGQGQRQRGDVGVLVRSRTRGDEGEGSPRERRRHPDGPLDRRGSPGHASDASLPRCPCRDRPGLRGSTPCGQRGRSRCRPPLLGDQGTLPGWRRFPDPPLRCQQGRPLRSTDRPPDHARRVEGAGHSTWP